MRWAGAVFLVGYGLLAARRAWRPSGHTLEAEARRAVEPPTAASSRGRATSGRGHRDRIDRRHATRALLPVVLTCLALTWLNPHVYLDTVFLLGTVANTHGDARWVFAAGAMVASVVWFFGSRLRRPLPRPVALARRAPGASSTRSSPS